MDRCKYAEVKKEIDPDPLIPDRSWKPFLRQLLIASIVWSSYFQMGLSFGSPTVMVPQLRREARNESAVSTEMASWLSSAYHLAAIPWCVVLPLLAHARGRRAAFLLVCTTAGAGYICLYLSTDLTTILISDVIHGILLASQITICLMILTEYISPEHRGLFLTIKSATGCWGIWASNAIGTFLHWKNIALFGIACSVYNVSLLFILPESPLWLAKKGRIDECRKNHRWLRGTGKSAEKELEDLVNTVKVKNRSNFKDMFKGIRRREFYMPIALCGLLIAMWQFTGKYVFSVYAIDIIKKITNNESVAYTGMLILDGVTVLGMYVGCITSKYFNRRTLLFSCEIVGISFLLLMSLYLYLIHLEVLTENVYASIAMLVGFSMSISCGPIILATSLCGELAPLKYRTLAIILIALMTNSMTGVTIKTAPMVFQRFGLHGGFLLYATGSLFFLVLLFKYLPETKNKTLKEIESHFKRKSIDEQAKTDLI